METNQSKIIIGTDPTGRGGNESALFGVNSTSVQIVFSILYSVIFLIGNVGNFFVVFAVFRNKNMHSVTNYFIANLAVSDILMSIFSVPLTPLYTFLRRWVFGEFLCHFVPFVQGVSIYISTLTLTIIAIDRYYVIVHPFKSRMTLNTCTVCILGIWLCAALLTCPYAIYMRNSMFKGNYFCEENWPEHVRLVFTLTTSTIQFVIPFTVMTCCYTMVFLRLGNRARSRIASSKSSKKEEADRERKRKVNRMLVSMVVIFGVCWLPFNMMNLILDINNDLIHESIHTLCFITVHVIAMSSICYNPFLYAWLNENFRREFRSITPCIVGKDNMRRISTTNTTFHETALTTYSLQQPGNQVYDERNNIEEVPLQPLATLIETNSEYNLDNSQPDVQVEIQVSCNTKKEWL
ncbi:GPR83 (predicted) [Pycnogonum litorale]